MLTQRVMIRGRVPLKKSRVIRCTLHIKFMHFIALNPFRLTSLLLPVSERVERRVGEGIIKLVRDTLEKM